MEDPLHYVAKEEKDLCIYICRQKFILDHLTVRRVGPLQYIRQHNVFLTYIILLKIAVHESKDCSTMNLICRHLSWRSTRCRLESLTCRLSTSRLT